MSSTATVPKVMTALIRRPDLSREDFARYYEQTHAPLGATYIPWRKYVRNHLVNASPADPGYDCLGEFWLDSMASLGAVLAGPLGEFYARDEAQFMKLNPPGPGGWATSSTARAADVTEHLLYGSPRAVDSSAILK